MKRHEIIQTIVTPIFELGWIVWIFFLAYNLRQITDGIPGIQLPIPYISPDQFYPFIVSWVFFWGVLFGMNWLYRNIWERPLFDTIRSIIVHSALWFMMYIGFVYLSTGFIFSKEIPRLIIGYVYVLSTLFSIVLRISIYLLMGFLYKKKILPKQEVLIIWDKTEEKLHEDYHCHYTYISPQKIEKIEDLIRNRSVQSVLLLSWVQENEKNKIIKLCSIYAVSFSYPKILPEVYWITQKESFTAWMLVIESTALKIGAWWRIFKRFFDILFSWFGLILLSPILIIIWILIKWEDPSWPIIFKNRRIWYGSKEFSLYKFRYMYWKYSVKDAYGVNAQDDEALKYEEELRKTSDGREGPLYKIKNDPRKTRIWRIIEKLSLDELPQLWNVFIWDMSLVWPRPHQPREVQEYDEHHFQLLTIKPWITGMAQVFGRDKNTFEDEVRYDIYYIEHYSLLLDFLILAKTFLVIIIRAMK